MNKTTRKWPNSSTKKSGIKKKVTAGRIIDWCASFHPLNYLSESTRPAASVKSCVNFDYSKSGCCQTDPKSGCDATLLSKDEDLATRRISSIFVLAVIISTETPLLRRGRISVTFTESCKILSIRRIQCPTKQSDDTATRIWKPAADRFQ